MRTNGIYKLALITALLISGAFTSQAQSTSSTSAVSSGAPIYFGTPQEFGGVCVGRGICPDPATSTGINVTVATVDEYPNTIAISFSLSQLQQVQPEQVSYFQSGSYLFDADLCISNNALFSSLNLPANSWILTTSNSVVQINGDVVTDYVQYTVQN